MPNTREKLIELLQCSPTDVMGNRGVGALADHLIANGVTLANQVASSIKQVASSKWIPVTERLPDKAEQVLALTKAIIRTRIDEDYITWLVWYKPKKGAFYHYDSEYGEVKAHDVTHWMPLPEPPKGE